MMNTCLKKLRRWWQIRTGRYETPFDGEVPFWVLSLCIQLFMLALLAKLLLPNADFRNEVVFVGEQNDIIELAEETFPDVEFDDIEIDQLSNQSDVQLEIVSSEDSPLVELAAPTSITTEVVFDDFGEFSADSSAFDVSPIASANNTAGSVGSAVTGASGAVDRLTQEILASLEDNATMVVWLFDQSASLTKQRKEIERRIDRIYRELNLLEASNSAAFNKTEDKPLLTQVYAFGRSIRRVLKQPTDDVENIKSAIAGIERDESGIENVFSSVIKVAKDFSDYRKVIRKTGMAKRNVMIVVICDEAGDDGAVADDAIKTCNKLSIPVYVIGVPAPFGRAETRVKWVDPDPQYDQSPQVALVSQGPESLMPERLRMNFIGGNFRDLEMIDSGFGPFNLTRLCYQSGGIYFAVHPNRRKGRVGFRETEVYSSDLRYFFDPEVMRKYQPEYVSVGEYKKRVKANRARSSLVQAAGVEPVNQLSAPRFRFQKTNEAEFVRSVSDAQRASAVLQPRLNRLYDLMKDGEIDREKEASPRWRAGFDLAIGRVIAAMLRSKTYNEMLALSKTKLQFKNAKNNTWVLQPSNNLSVTGSQNEKLASKAKMYLDRVVEEHPGTPWALLAKRELATPLGWKWKEDYTPPPVQTRPRQGNGNNNPRNPQPQQNQMPKQKRPVPKL